MKAMKKIGTLFVLMLLALTVAVPFVSAAPSVSIDKVEVNGMVLENQDDAVYVERGTLAEVEVELTGLENQYYTQVEVWIGGYEYDLIQDNTRTFEVKDGVKYQKTLTLEIPEDLRASNDYTLNVVVTTDDDKVEMSYTLMVEESRHLLNIYDVIVSPSNTVKAGQPLFVSIRVENLGDSVEEDIKVTASIPALGVDASEYIDELISDEDENLDSGWEFDEEDAESTDDLVIMIPRDAESGQYDLVVKVEYDRGHAVEEKVLTLNVNGATGTATVEGDDNTQFSVSSSELSFEAGDGAVYTVSLANLGNTAKTFDVAVSGTQGWASYRVDPATLTLAAGEAGEALVYVTANENVAPGSRTFTVEVSADGQALEELSLTANVSKTSTGFDTFKKVLEVVFIVLLVVLIVLGILIVARKLSDGDDAEDTIEGQTYY